MTNCGKDRFEEPEAFWGEIANEYVEWFKNGINGKTTIFHVKKGPSTLNISRVESSTSLTTVWTNIKKPAAIKSPSSGKAMSPVNKNHFTYKQLHEQVCKLPNVLKATV